MNTNKYTNTTENTYTNTSTNTIEKQKKIEKQKEKQKKITYYTSLKTDINWSDCIIVVYLLIFSKINNCPIFLDKSYFSTIIQIIFNLIVIDTNYTLKQKVFIINMIQLYDNIYNNSFCITRMGRFGAIRCHIP